MIKWKQKHKWFWKWAERQWLNEKKRGMAWHGIAMVWYDIAIVYSNDIGMTTTMITLERIGFWNEFALSIVHANERIVSEQTKKA